MSRLSQQGLLLRQLKCWPFLKKRWRSGLFRDPYGDVPIERFYFEQIVRNELSVHGSWNALSAPFPGREWKATIHYMKTGAINGAPMISHRLPLNQGPDVFKRMTSGEKGFVKVLFYPQGKERSV